MKKKRFYGTILLLVIIISVFSLAACTSTQNSAASAPDEVGSAVVDEATDAVKDIAREETRRGINSIFRRR